MRPKLIETPEKLYELFKQYRQWAKSNPYLFHDYVGKDAAEVWKKRERPLTWIGFEGYLAENGIVYHLGNYEHNDRGAYSDYLPIIRMIKKQCSNDTVSGALAGVYNQNIAARLEGLSDRSDVNLSDNRKSVADLFPLDEEKTE